MDKTCRKILFYSVLIISIFVVSFFILETLLRIKGDFYSWGDKNGLGYNTIYDRIGLSKNWYHIRYPGGTDIEKRPEFEFTVKMNSEGVRDIEHPLKKSSGEIRIVTFGDSFTEGVGASFENIWPVQLSRSLNSKISKKKITIINGGVAASDPFYSYKLLTDRLIKYEPDIVMLAINATDIVDVIGRGGLERFLPDGTVKYMDPPISIYFFKHSHVVRAIMLRLLNYNWYGLGKKDDAEKSVKALKKIEEIICKYEAFLNYRNIKFVTIVHPLYKETLRTEMRTDLTELVSSLIKKNIEVYDLRKYIRGKIPPMKEEVDKYFWPVDTHMNLNGYKLFAEGVEEYLLASEWFLNRINKKNQILLNK